MVRGKYRERRERELRTQNFIEKKPTAHFKGEYNANNQNVNTATSKFTFYEHEHVSLRKNKIYNTQNPEFVANKQR